MKRLTTTEFVERLGLKNPNIEVSIISSNENNGNLKTDKKE